MYDRIKYADGYYFVDEMKNMLYTKKPSFCHQSEYRICLQQTIDEPSINVEVGSLKDIALLVPIKSLEKGIIVGHSAEEIERIRQSLNINPECISLIN